MELCARRGCPACIMSDLVGSSRKTSCFIRAPRCQGAVRGTHSNTLSRPTYMPFAKPKTEGTVLTWTDYQSDGYNRSSEWLIRIKDVGTRTQLYSTLMTMIIGFDRVL
jgi:hypothetical protein